MTEARKHHFLSQCYLKRFTQNGIKDSKLLAVNLSDGRTFSTKPLNVGAKRDFNRLEGLSPGVLEKALSPFEAEVDAALNRICKLESLGEFSDWNSVLNLMALFAVRNPRLRNQMGNYRDEALKMSLSMILSTPERFEHHIQRAKETGYIDDEMKVTYEQVKEFHDRGEYDIITPNTTHIALEFDIHDTVLIALGNRVWRLYTAESNSGGFITSDHPVCLMHSDGSSASFQRPLGFESPDSTVIFPLSNKLLAVGTFGEASGTGALSALQVAIMNSYSCNHAEKQIYASGNTFKVAFGKKLNVLTSSEFSCYLENKSKSLKQ